MAIDLDSLARNLQAPPSGRTPVQWRRARRALRALLADPDSTQHAFEVRYALDGDDAARLISRFTAHPEGRKLLFDRPSLLAVLADREGLARMPEGSFGRAYLDHLERNGFDPASLCELRRGMDPVKSRDEATEWFLERIDLQNDLWHVLTGYGADGAGEASLLPFTLAQRGGRSTAFLSFGAGLQMTRRVGLRWLSYAWRAWRRGRRALALDVLPYESLLPLPLADVRRAVGLEPPELAHPDGIIEVQAGARAA